MKYFIMILLFITTIAFADSNVLEIGYISSDPAGTIAKMKPFTDYATQNFKSNNTKSVITVVAKDVNEMISLMKEGKVDIFIDTLSAVFDVNNSVGLDLAFRRWKKGVGEYKTLFLSKKSSSLTNLKSLNGLKIGFEDPSSTSGRWLPQSVLAAEGYSFTNLSNDSLKPNTIGFMFTGSSENTPVWIMQGKIDVGVVSTTDYDEIPAGLKSNLKIIGETQMVPRQLITIVSDLPVELKKDIKNFLLNISTSDSGKAMLSSWEKTSTIDEITPKIKNEIDTFKNQLKLIK